ncbi:MAG TPA: 6,7-dimethyl-8-ribityllumazine synthase [Candidatus Polarisedimenticolia bacterium]|jgi:6,7-dimethyl-8-ribityllumazine synthase
MPETIEGGHQARGLRFAVVASRYNETACDRLLEGALECLRRHGAQEADVTVVRVPGSWEIPVVARRLALSRSHDALIALGVLLRGETSHFDLVARQVAEELAALAATTGVPVAFGVLAAENVEQVFARAGEGERNRGWEAAMAAIETANVMKRLETV